MKTCFMDTNLFIRYLVNDDPGKADRVEKLLEQVDRGKFAAGQKRDYKKCCWVQVPIKGYCRC